MGFQQTADGALTWGFGQRYVKYDLMGREVFNRRLPANYSDFSHALDRAQNGHYFIRAASADLRRADNKRVHTVRDVIAEVDENGRAVDEFRLFDILDPYRDNVIKTLDQGAVCLNIDASQAGKTLSAEELAEMDKDDKFGDIAGVGAGRNGDIVVQMTVKAGKIADVKIVKHAETVGISDAAIATVPKAIVEAQSTGVDAVTGATMTTDGIKAAVAAAIKAAGGDPAEYAVAVVKKKAAPKLIRENADIVVVGAGGAGISAAVKAETLGKSVILIEKMPTIGGATVLNAGTLIATGSKYQREVMKETKDSPELAYKDIFRVGKDRNDPVLVKMVTEKVGSVVDWLIYDMKIPYGPAATQYPDHSANRQLGVEGRSINYLNLMRGKFLDMGGKLMLETRAQAFIRDKDGVKAVDANGNTVELTSKAVILASGGYGADQSMLPEKMKGYLFYGVDGETGDGYKMATSIGADTINLDLAISVLYYTASAITVRKDLILPAGMTEREAFVQIISNFFRGISTTKGLLLVDDYLKRYEPAKTVHRMQ